MSEKVSRDIFSEMSSDEMDRLMRDDTFSEFKSFEIEFRKFWLEWFEQHHHEMANRFKDNYYALVKLAHTLRTKESLSSLPVPHHSRSM